MLPPNRPDYCEIAWANYDRKSYKKLKTFYLVVQSLEKDVQNGCKQFKSHRVVSFYHKICNFQNAAILVLNLTARWQDINIIGEAVTWTLWLLLKPEIPRSDPLNVNYYWLFTVLKRRKWRKRAPVMAHWKYYCKVMANSWYT